MASFSLNFNNLFTPATQPQWMSTLISLMTQLQVPATSWQSGGVARTLVTLFSYLGAAEDGLISIAAQGGFLDFAASGTVTYTTLSGQTVTVSVTPDPSTLSGADLSAWKRGWLDILADGSYNVQRLSATNATGPVAFANTTGAILGPYPAGTLHISNPTTGATYSNTGSVTIPAASSAGGGISTITNPNGGLVTITTSVAHGLASGNTVYLSGISGQTGLISAWVITVTSSTAFTLNGVTGNGVASTGGTVNTAVSAIFSADVAGSAGTSAIGTITNAITSLVGVRIVNTSALTGTNWESNAQLAVRCRLKLQALSPNGAAGAYQYFALTASQLITGYKTSDAGQLVLGLTAPINRVKVVPNPGTGVVTTTVANANGAVLGATNLPVTGASNASPISITTSAPHGATTGQYVYIAGVQGNTASNGFWQITVTGGSTFTLNGSTGNGAYTSGGSVEISDLGLVDFIIQSSCVPNGITAIVQSAAAQNVAVVGTVYVPTAQVVAYTAAVANALTNFFAVLPIGGLDTDGGTNLLPYDDVVGVLYAAGIIAGTQTSYVRGITGVTVGGGTVDLSIGLTSVAVLSPAPAIAVVGQ